MKRGVRGSLIIIITICLMGCDLKKPVKESSLFNNNEAVLKRVRTNVEEAKLLSEIAILNETVGSLIQLSRSKNSDYYLRNLSNKLGKDNLKIKKQLRDLADKKLILLPDSIDKQSINDLSNIEKDDFSKAYLNKIIQVLTNEAESLEYLSIITNDVDFKVLAVKITTTLEFNIDQTQKVLKSKY